MPASRGASTSRHILIDAGTTDKMTPPPQGRRRLHPSAGPASKSSRGVGHIVAALADASGTCAFSSLAATREWLATDMAKRFMRAYRKARAWLIATPAAEVAKVEAPFFKDIDLAVLTQTIAAYQKLGNWTPHVEITRPAFEATLDIFQHAGLITKRHRYEDIVAPPPA
jgi:NitT/TauT family transport system substrate-binding protein